MFAGKCLSVKGFSTEDILTSHRSGIMIPNMRTTLTLDPDVARRLKSEMGRTGTGLKAVVNQALRIGLGMTDKPVRPRPFKVVPHSFGFRTGIDLDRMNQLADNLEAEDTAHTPPR